MVNTSFSWTLVTKENLLPSLDLPCYSDRMLILSPLVDRNVDQTLLLSIIKTASNSSVLQTNKSLCLNSTQPTSGLQRYFEEQGPKNTLFILGGRFHLDFDVSIFKCHETSTGNIDRVKIGSWNSKSPETLWFEDNMEHSLNNFGVMKILKVLVVQRQPFVFWNETTGFVLYKSFLLMINPKSF